jgi:hypothetical protein
MFTQIGAIPPVLLSAMNSRSVLRSTRRISSTSAVVASGVMGAP